MSVADGARLAASRRTQCGATALLLAMLLLTFASAAQVAAHPWLHWARAFAEAGAGGATADWYAAVALFRHPLALPIPHSAINPANQHRREPRGVRRTELPHSREHRAPAAAAQRGRPPRALGAPEPAHASCNAFTDHGC